MPLKDIFNSVSPKKALLICLCFFFILLLKESSRVYEVGDAPSKYGDGFSENNAMLGAKAFKQYGLLKNYGLPDHCSYKSSGATNCVYTHYPPGPEYFLYFGHFFTGQFNYIHLRILALLINFSLMTGFAWLLLRRFQPQFAVIFIGLISAHPFFSRFAHNLHYQGFAFYILLIQFALAVQVDACRSKYLMLQFFLSFLQGWLSFDYFFISALVPVMMFSSLNGFSRKDAFFLLIASAGGFTFAHILHFLQVILYFGGLETAVTDFLHAAKNRSSNEVLVMDWIPPEALNPFGLVYRYFTHLSKKQGFLPTPIHRYLLYTLGLGLLYHLMKFRKLHFRELISLRWGFFIIGAFLVSSLWVIVMRQHSYIHFFFINQHYAVFIMIWIFWLSERVLRVKACLSEAPKIL